MKEDYKLIAVVDGDGEIAVHKFTGMYKECWDNREDGFDYGSEYISDYEGEVLIVANTQDELSELIQLYREWELKVFSAWCNNELRYN